MEKTLYSKRFPSTAEAIRDILTEALEALVRHNWCSRDNTFPVRLCLEEALVNAVEHGNNSNPDLFVQLDIRENGGRCHVTVKDEGVYTSFDPNAIEMPDCETLGGRGVCLIRHYMDEVEFNRDTSALVMKFGRNTFACEV